jgi:uracil-DNA glycosylase
MLKYLTGVKRPRVDGVDVVAAAASTLAAGGPSAAAATGGPVDGTSSKEISPLPQDPALQQSLLSLGIPLGHPTTSFLLLEARKPYFPALLAFVASARSKGPVFPPHGKELAALSLYPHGLDTVKVVILGQDPYHGPGQAHGLSFSVPRGVALPPSLLNIIKEVTADVGAAGGHTGSGSGSGSGSGGGAPPPFKPSHGNLEGWASSGVLLLNTCLTVSSGQANSHAGKGWEKLTDAIISHVSKVSKQGVVFMLWGKPAQEKKRLLSGSSKHLILEAPHPSPLSAHRGFLGCKHFSKCNTFLVSKGMEPIDWLGALGK